MTNSPNNGQVNLSWQDSAKCKGQSELFFGHYNERTGAKIEREKKARAICMSCPVLQKCRDHARAFAEYGFWGGESEEERYESGFAIGNPTIRRKINRSKTKQTQ